jgi:hypothetical protein
MGLPGIVKVCPNPGPRYIVTNAGRHPRKKHSSKQEGELKGLRHEMVSAFG